MDRVYDITHYPDSDMYVRAHHCFFCEWYSKQEYIVTCKEFKLLSRKTSWNVIITLDLVTWHDLPQCWWCSVFFLDSLTHTVKLFTAFRFKIFKPCILHVVHVHRSRTSESIILSDIFSLLLDTRTWGCTSRLFLFVVTIIYLLNTR